MIDAPLRFGEHLTKIMSQGQGTPDRRPWTDPSLANALSVSQNTIANWRRGRNWPSTANYKKLLTGFALDRDDASDAEVIKLLDEALQRERASDDASPVQNTDFIHFCTAFPSTPAISIPRKSVDDWLATRVGNSGLAVVVGGGGAGKSTSVRHWLVTNANPLTERFHRCFIWSFYRQGQTSEFISGEMFFANPHSRDCRWSRIAPTSAW